MRALFASEKVAVLLGRTIDAIGSLAFLKLLSLYTEKSDVGMYLLATSVLAILLTVSYSALDQGFLRNITEYRKQGALAPRYSATLAGYCSSSLLFAWISFGFLSAIGAGDSLREILIPISIWLVFEVTKNLNNIVASALRSRYLMAGASAIDYGCRLVFLWCLFSTGALSAPAIIGLLTVASAAASLFLIWGHRKLLARFSSSDFRATLHDSIKFSWPMVVWGAFGWLQNMSNRWLLSRFVDLPTVAEYGILVSIGTFPVTAMFGVVVTYLQPILYEKESGSRGASRAIVKRIALGLVPVCAILVLITAVWHRELTVLLSDAQYAGRSDVLPFIVGAACTSALATTLSYAIFAQRRVSSLLLANTIPGLFSVMFGYFAVGTYQFWGAIATLVLGHLLAALLFVVAFAYGTIPPREGVHK